MTNLIVQKLFILVLGEPASGELGDTINERYEEGGWAALTGDINAYLGGRASEIGATALVRQLAHNGFGLDMNDGDAAAVAALVTDGGWSWAELVAYAINEIGGDLGATLEGRARAENVPAPPVNVAPQGANVALTFEGRHDFDAHEFGYSDVNGDAMAAVRIDTLPFAGHLYHFMLADPIEAGFVIPASELWMLYYVPPAGYWGPNFDWFTYSVQDSQGAFDPSPNRITLNVYPAPVPVEEGPDVNDTPTGITITDASFDENVSGAFVGTLGAVDPDDGESFTFEISGGGDGGHFYLDGADLYFSGTADFEDASGNTFDVNITVTDSEGATFTDTISVSVNDVNEAPTDITISNDDIGSGDTGVIGTLSTIDPDAGESFTYEITSGNAAFDIVGSDLVLSSGLADNEVGYDVSIRVTDSGGLTYTETIHIDVGNTNDAPTDITIDVPSIDENTAGNVGALSAEDGDVGDTHTFTLTADSFDNDLFTISGNMLELASDADFETASSYTVEIHVEDLAGSGYTRTIEIAINDVNEAPTDISLSASDIDENVSGLVGTFTTTDEDGGESFTYALVAGTGDDDNALFGISSGGLYLLDPANYEATQALSVRVEVTDSGGATYEEAFSITINDDTGESIFTEGSDDYTAGNGDDTLDGLDGDDTIDGQGGADSIIGGAGNDSLTAGQGGDTVDGGDGNDVIVGGQDEDFLLGGAGNDSIDGDQGDDTIRGGAGNDFIQPKEGADKIYFEASGALNGTDTIDALNLADDTLYIPASFVNQVLSDGGTGGVVIGSGSIVPFTIGSNDNANIGGSLALYQAATNSLGLVDSAADIAGLMDDGDITIGNNSKAVLFTGRANGNEMLMWYIETDGTDGVTAAEVTLVANISPQTGGFRLGDMVVSDFVFY